MTRSLSVKDVIKRLEELAPPGLAMSWDNVGLQLGDPAWPADKIMLTLDVTGKTVETALKEGVQLIVSHHPLIFKPVARVTDPLLLRLAGNGIAVYCAHTNLDTVREGVSGTLAQCLGITDISLLTAQCGTTWLKGSVFIPAMATHQLAEAIFEAGAGRIGRLDHSLSVHELQTHIRLQDQKSQPGAESLPLDTQTKTELEFFVDEIHLAAVTRAIHEAHPSESPVYYFSPVRNESPNYGMGCLGKLSPPISLKTFATRVKERLNAPWVTLWPGDRSEDALVERVAVCGGSGKSLIPLIGDRADVFVTGDLDYHTIIESPLPLIDAGHFYTEYPVLAKLKDQLSSLECETVLFTAGEHTIGNLRKI